jgi:hypothetical protein
MLSKYCNFSYSCKKHFYLVNRFFVLSCSFELHIVLLLEGLSLNIEQAGRIDTFRQNEFADGFNNAIGALMHADSQLFENIQLEHNPVYIIFSLQLSVSSNALSLFCLPQWKL